MDETNNKIRFNARGMELSHALKDYFLDKIEKLEHQNLIEWADVEFGQTIAHRGADDDFYVRVLLKLPKVYVRVKKTGSDIYALVDEVVDILSQKVQQYFEELSDNKGKKKLVVVLDKELQKADSSEPSEATKYLDYKPRVRRKELQEMTPITVAEAITHLELLDLPAYLFRNIDDNNSVQMIYKEHGEYVLVVPPEV